ncbi:1-acyl-sn-glycerol-3-phosphate acyltransferase [Roseibaca ekhonensis]|jgi:1-acyl-sn-glycerol-3-phosphate acyltransferase|uniref:1-acyl-sn-glycerol-3-phosphate acyltransferase n=1 Tax=Roseinatronobacter ekhonensis TaxID=254356 RepID=A0A3B0M546_9RHOB|nr:lysophospholipid acyltransferase family protein [Roseibaca ekhonensis]SUZ31225.1 1-acyl-sn-glycerol-3-phosphate acyltransferase [Roseibaca ekhonensis]
MRLVVQYIRSFLFIVQMYLAMAIMALAFAPFALVRREMALKACHTYCRYVRWSAGWMVGLRADIRGEIPQGGALVAAKHQSFFDIILIFGALPNPRFIMKKQLKYAPFLGWYAMRLGCIPVDRGKGGVAIRDMLARVEQGREAAGQIIIYPQGTRVAPGDNKPYKVGSALLYGQLGQPCVPVATNVGLFWPKRSMLRKPGMAVVEFLPPIAAGVDQRQFLATLERVVEDRSNALMADAGFAPLG